MLFPASASVSAQYQRPTCAIRWSGGLTYPRAREMRSCGDLSAPSRALVRNSLSDYESDIVRVARTLINSSWLRWHQTLWSKPSQEHQDVLSVHMTFQRHHVWRCPLQGLTHTANRMREAAAAERATSGLLRAAAQPVLCCMLTLQTTIALSL